MRRPSLMVPLRHRQIQRAALLCKADLVSEMVYEFPELQGIMGEKYALASGEDAEVARAIFEHYLPRNADDIFPATLTGQIVGLADRLDTLISIFGLGLIPSGSSDPFALRRAANSIINITWNGNLPINLDQLLAQIATNFSTTFNKDAKSLITTLQEFFLQRIRTLLQEEKQIDYDLVNAVLGENDPEYTERALQDLLDVRDRATYLQQIRNDGTLDKIYETINRSTRLAAQGDLDYQQLEPKTLIIIGSEINIPKELQDIITVLEFQLPLEDEISQEVTRLMNSLNIEINSQLFENLTKACQGLSLERIRRVLSKIIATYKTIDDNSIKVLLSEKKQIISQTEILEYASVNEKITNLGGLDNLKDWLRKRKKAFSIQAYNYGLPTPRGLLLIGIQGTGKSLTAKAIANEWQLPLLKLDVGKLFGGIVGESESRLRQMINVAETISPCILWIDEIDKAFSNTESKGDSGTSNRVLATFISWLSEKKKPVFVISTANNIDLLPLEIIRKGRFDEIFFLDLPQKKEREEIFKIHLKEFRPSSWESFNYSELAKLSESFSGAEIRQSIIEGMYHAFYEKREFTTDDICMALNELIPLAHLESNQMLKLQNWASSGRIRLASAKNIYLN